MFYSSANHKKTFLELLKKFNKVYEDGKVDQEYAAAYYILTSSEELWRESKRHIGIDGIDFEGILKNDFSSGHMVMVKLASNLFNGNIDVTPREICWYTDEENFRIAINGITMFKTSHTFSDLEQDIGKVGRPKSIDIEKLKLLKDKGMTQEAIARIMHVSISTIRRSWKNL